MSQTSQIEWTEATWNPVVGCTKISPGCKNCNAEPLPKRLQAMGVAGYDNGFKLTILPERLSVPLRRKKRTIYRETGGKMQCHRALAELENQIYREIA